jgi:hypothetical protein
MSQFGLSLATPFMCSFSVSQLVDALWYKDIELLMDR